MKSSPALRPPCARDRFLATLAITVPLLLAGCTNTASRLCPGFDHPGGMTWTGNATDGDVRTFADARGDGVTYELRSVERSEPREQGSTDRTDDEVDCRMSADYLYVSDALDTAVELSFMQLQGEADQPFDEQLLGLQVSVQSPIGRPVIPGPGFQFSLTDLDSTFNNINADTVISSFSATASVGGMDYTEVLEETRLDGGQRYADGEVPESGQWVRVVLANGVGLVQYELLNGTVYTLVPG